jgi:hypothetical protein
VLHSGCVEFDEAIRTSTTSHAMLGTKNSGVGKEVDRVGGTPRMVSLHLRTPPPNVTYLKASSTSQFLDVGGGCTEDNDDDVGRSNTEHVAGALP